MTAGLVRTLAAAAAYGFSIGTVYGFGQAAENLLKFPILVVLTTAVSAPAWYVLSRAAIPGLPFRDAQRLAADAFRDLSVLLAALAPACLFLGLTAVPPVSEERLGEYPQYLLMNVAFIAAAGGIAVLRHARRLGRVPGATRPRVALLVAAWLGVTLAAGGQAAWYLRPYFGRAFETNVPFALGTTPGYRGATNFFEVVWYLAGGSAPGH